MYPSAVLVLLKLAGETAAPQASAISRLIAREGGYTRLTKDTGGETLAGIAETSGMPAAQIRALTPGKINQFWGDKWKDTSGVQNPGVREILFDMQANMGAPRANRLFQNTLNQLNPKGPQLKPDGVLGSGSLDAANKAMQDDLAERMMAGFKQHHEGLAARNPAKYGPYAKGWANRRASLWDSPAVTPLRKVAPLPAAPVSTKPVLVKGTPPPDAKIIPAQASNTP